MLKNSFDKTFALIGLLVLWPLLLLIALLIRVKMPDGAALFRQQRVGQHGKLFTMVKFRTMTTIHHGSSISVAGESRITPLGAFLRKYKLDEVPGYADKLIGKDRDILQLKPGITGPATLKYRNEEELLAQQANPQQYNDEVIFPDKVKINLEYLRHHSFWGDIRIIIQTIL